MSVRQSLRLDIDLCVSDCDSSMSTCGSSANIWWLTSWVVIILLIDVVYKQNRKGPRTDPCGTPKWRYCGHESDPSMWTRCCLFVMYDLNHCKTVPEILKCPCSRSKRVAWSIVSKAADKSNSVSAVTLPLSMLHIISLWILRRAVSVEWKRYTPITLYPTAPLYDIIIIFDTVLRQKRICKREK